jgi:hypothetical protein
VKEQLDKTGTGAPAANTQVINKAKELRAGLDAIAEGSSGLDAANMKLISALNAVESSDRQAPSQAYAVYRLARTASHAKLMQWAALKTGSLAALNEELKAQGLPSIAISGGQWKE